MKSIEIQHFTAQKKKKKKFKRELGGVFKASITFTIAHI